MTRPLLLDLYCGGGGAAMGYYRAGFDVVGVDINKQGNYPFPFWQADALAAIAAPFGARWREVRAIHASPPCQLYTGKSADWGRKRNHWIEHPDLVGPTRDELEDIGLPYVIENVPRAPIRTDLVLCGSMFGLRIQKHRLFESNVPMPLPPAACDHSDMYNPWAGQGRSADKGRHPRPFVDGPAVDAWGTGAKSHTRMLRGHGTYVAPVTTDRLMVAAIRSRELHR